MKDGTAIGMVFYSLFGIVLGGEIFDDRKAETETRDARVGRVKAAFKRFEDLFALVCRFERNVYTARTAVSEGIADQVGSHVRKIVDIDVYFLQIFIHANVQTFRIIGIVQVGLRRQLVHYRSLCSGIIPCRRGARYLSWHRWLKVELRRSMLDQDIGPNGDIIGAKLSYLHLFVPEFS